MKREQKPSKAAKPFVVIGVIVAIVVVVLALLEFGSDQSPDESTAGFAETSEVATPSNHSAQVNLESRRDRLGSRLKGRWLREDGGYVLEIREVAADGRLTAAYFNPNPIHVSKAAVVEEGGTLKVGVELNDVNYPGCLYTLVLDPQLDQLIGTYFQAALGQSFQVAFVRMAVD